MRRRNVWIAVGVAAVVLGGVATGVIGPRVARAAGDAATAGLMPAGGRSGPLAGLIRQSLGDLRKLGGELQLTADQRQEIRGIVQAHRQDIVAVARDVRDAHRKVSAAVRAEPMDERAIRRAARGMADSLGDAAVLHAKVRHEAFAKLTPDQISKIEACRADIESNVDQALAAAGK